MFSLAVNTLTSHTEAPELDSQIWLLVAASESSGDGTNGQVPVAHVGYLD